MSVTETTTFSGEYKTFASNGTFRLRLSCLGQLSPEPISVAPFCQMFSQEHPVYSYLLSFVSSILSNSPRRSPSDASSTPPSKSSSSPRSFKYLKLSDLAGLVPGNRPSRRSRFHPPSPSPSPSSPTAFASSFVPARSALANRVLALTAPVRVDRDRGFAFLSPPLLFPLDPRPRWSFVRLDALGTHASAPSSSSPSLPSRLDVSRAVVVGALNRTAPIPVVFGVDAGLTTCRRSKTGAPGSAGGMSPARTSARRARELGRRRVRRRRGIDRSTRPLEARGASVVFFGGIRSLDGEC